MDEIETEFIEIQESKSLVWFRDVDDVFFIWTQGKDKLEKFLNNFNNYHPNIKFSYEFNKESISFLDLKVSLSGGLLTTNLHVKPADRHQYFHFISAHLHHTKRTIAFSQALRVSRIYSYEKDFEKHTENMKS